MRTPSFRLDGRRALVTGASRGIGLAAAHALAEAGAEVVVAARSADALQRAADAIAAEHGARVTPWVVDVADSAGVREGLRRHGPFHVVVNNAGINRPGPVEGVTDDDLDVVLQVNVKAVFYVCREAAAMMREHGIAGSIINVSSQLGHVGLPERTIYCASKHAVEGLTKALAWELGRDGIRVNNVCPTVIATEMTRAMLDNPDVLKASQAKIALGRVGQPEDMMGAFVFLASDAASLITGSSVMVDGGWTAV